MKTKVRLTIDLEIDLPEDTSIDTFGREMLTWNLSGNSGYEGSLQETGWGISELIENSQNTPFYEKEFRCGNSYVSRGELEGFPLPFNTEGVSDETMQKLVNTVDEVTKGRLHLPSDKLLDLKDEKTGDIWWEELELICRELEIPYYNENEN